MIEDQEGDKQKVLALAKKHASEHGFEGEASKAFIEAFIENFDKGRAEERAKAYLEKIERVKQMLTDGMSVDLIAKYSGLSVEEIKSL